jgi:DNA polymerase I-like protein with 3'-5' exonuclease and polymerase domains
MNILTVDFETYYDREYSLSKITMEDYVRNDLFETIGVSIKENDNEAVWFTGTHDEIKAFLQKYDWETAILVAHNASFDAAILSWIFDIRPFGVWDTLGMARAIDGIEVGNSLAKLADRYNLGVKGKEVIQALGKRRQHFTPSDLAQYGEYCKNDVNLTYKLLMVFLPKVSPTELKIMDITTRMFTEPVLELDMLLLEQHLSEVKERKAQLLEAANANKDVLMSNPKFAELLRTMGVEPPMKISPANGLETFAFAKSDAEFKELLEHPDERVQALVAARLGTKSTLEETRTERFINIAKRGKLPVPLRYYAAHTGRWGGDDKLNLQNLPARGTNALKNAILAPPGYVIIDADSSQIEARVLAWLSGQTDLVDAFAKGEDVYKIMASSIYSKPIEEITKNERFVGKTTILGAGYGMGAEKFQGQLLGFGTTTPLAECMRIIDVYRKTYPMIPQLWKQAGKCLDAMLRGVVNGIGVQPQALHMDSENGFVLPNGYFLTYNSLHKNGTEYTYKSRNGYTRIYGGKVVENLCQAIARCVIGEQMVRMSQKYRVVLTVHDAVACVVPEAEAEEAQKYIEECMRWTPEWATGLPLNCESGIGRNYGEC